MKTRSVLQQSALAGYVTLNKRLTSIRIHCCAEASAVYSRGNSFSQIFLAAGVDYLTLFGNEHDHEKLRSDLDSLFKLEFLRNARYLLGIENMWQEEQSAAEPVRIR